MGAEALASEVRSQGEDWSWLREHSLKGASAQQLAWRESGEKFGLAKEAKDHCFEVHEERGFKAQIKRAPGKGTSCGYQRRPQRWAWNANVAAAATKNPVCKHRSLSTNHLLGACATCHCQGPMMQGQLHWENTQHTSGGCKVTLASAAKAHPAFRTPPSPWPE